MVKMYQISKSNDLENVQQRQEISQLKSELQQSNDENALLKKQLQALQETVLTPAGVT
jgi:predicted  nucleic acid-binding Zn-ribbon protein